ncbi:hypothetical protein CAPTEDRAFT_120680 [Capitella teleta]|uniref:Endonuclease n=1 Tax=Capitella teleta TaxID=283909 RepID=R7V668_CAPTE|nr:hypothetical protein CAPTEDRAFT_120680 [Capitella teleta]|eukprot:ELU14358.1 hypothetical protein CAPTEDRAFT_120680 [Capitella teleta]
MARYLSRRALSVVCTSFGVCAGSIAHWTYSSPKSSNHNGETHLQGHQSKSSNYSDEAVQSAKGRIIEKFDRWLPRVEASTSIIPGGQPENRATYIGKGVMTRFSVPEMKGFVAYDDYVLHYDRRTRNAHWVFEHLTRERVKASEEAKRDKSEFHEEPKVHPFFRSTNSDYKGSGYDRGHLAAAGNHRWSQQAMNQTFSLANISPQVGKGFNRDAWNTLEMFTRKLTKDFPDLYVVTGPLYLPRREDDGKVYIKYEVIGKNQIAVPTHYFKVIVMAGKSGGLELMSFVMPNQVLPANVDLRNYLVPLNTIERASGLVFFDSIPREMFTRVNAKEQIS